MKSTAEDFTVIVWENLNFSWKGYSLVTYSIFSFFFLKESFSLHPCRNDRFILVPSYLLFLPLPLSSLQQSLPTVCPRKAKEGLLLFGTAPRSTLDPCLSSSFSSAPQKNGN